MFHYKVDVNITHCNITSLVNSILIKIKLVTQNSHGCVFNITNSMLLYRSTTIMITIRINSVKSIIMIIYRLCDLIPLETIVL